MATLDMDAFATVTSSLIRLTAPSLMVSVAVFFLLKRVSSLAHLALAGALAMAFFVGYLALPEWAPLVPERYWHWLPYLAIAGAVAGTIVTVESLGVWRHAATLITFCVAAWLLVPTWPALAATRPWIIIALVVSFVAFSLLLAALAKRLPAHEFLTYLVMVSIAVAVCTAAGASIRNGQVAGVLAASVAGCCIVSWSARVVSKQLIAMIPCCAILAVGVTFVACIEPDPPFYELLLIPVTPAAVGIAQIGPLGRLEGAKATAVRGGLVVAALALACGLALI